MRDWTRTEARLQSIAARQLKISYKQLQPEEKKLIKILEVINQCSLEKDRFWQTHGNASRDENNHITLSDDQWGLFNFLDNRWASYVKKRERVIAKNNWNDEMVGRIQRSHMQNNCHSVSYGY